MPTHPSTDLASAPAYARPAGGDTARDPFAAPASAPIFAEPDASMATPTGQSPFTGDAVVRMRTEATSSDSGVTIGAIPAGPVGRNGAGVHDAAGGFVPFRGQLEK